jgi:soluble lytic murein transglycosylase-like protein
MRGLVRLLVCGASVCTAQSSADSQPQRLAEWAVDYYATQYGVPFEFVAAIIDVESALQPYVVSDKGAAGLMQLMPGTAYRFGVRNRFRIEENIRGGVAYLAFLMQEFHDLRLVAAAYYTGESRIARVGLNCADPDVTRYVSAVQRAYRNRIIERRKERNQ